MRKKGAWFLGQSVAAALMAGCSQQTLNSAQHDAQHDVAVVNQATQKAAKEAQPQIKIASLGARVTAALQAAGIQASAWTRGRTG